MLKVVTHNEGKFREIKKIINSVEMLNIEYPEIQSDSLEDVIEFALNYLSKKIDGNFIIDDSGIFIFSLNDFPGVYSAYIFKTIGNRGILKLMEGIENRSAYFKTVIGLRYENKNYKFIGFCHGRISSEIRGSNGFAYDSIFIPENHDKTFAEMKTEEKNKISHRGRAIRKLEEFLRKVGEI